MTNVQGPARVLAVGGSDSGGGAGIQADLKTLTSLGVYGATAVTSITIQNTQGIYDVRDLPPDLVVRQIEAVLEDIGADAVKSGMLSNAYVVEAVAECFEQRRPSNFVLDPVLAAGGGRRLLAEDALDVLKTRLFPLAALVTPNIPEAEALTGLSIRGEDDVKRAGDQILAHGCQGVVIKGGHATGEESVDWLFDGAVWRRFSARRVDSPHTHGTGCTFAAAIAAHLALGRDLAESVERAKQFVTEAIRSAMPLGRGRGPINHLWGISSG